MTSDDGGALERDIAERLATSRFHASLGITLHAVRPDGVELRMDAGPEHANLHGTVHGGVLATLADTAAGVAVRAALPDPGAPHATVLDADGVVVARAQATVAIAPPLDRPGQ